MPGGIDLKNEVLSSSSCALCGACLDWCPYIKNLADHIAMPFACNVQDGRCYAVCPRTFTDWTAIRQTFLPTVYEPELGAFTAIYRAKSAAAIEGQQDGGTVRSLVKTALEEVQAVLLTGREDDLSPISYLCSDPAEVEKAAGSQFLAAPGFRKINEALQQGVDKLLVVGRPCQIQALRKFQAQGLKNQHKPLEITSIGLFCMWSLSWEFKKYLQELYPQVEIHKISIPQHGIELQTSAGVKLLPTEKVKEFIRPGCAYCLDMTAELADISVGSFEAEPGWNTVLVRSSQGAALVQKAADKKTIVLEEYPAHQLAALQRASVNKKARNLKTMQAAAEAGRLKLFIDMDQAEYTEIINQAEGMVKS